MITKVIVQLTEHICECRDYILVGLIKNTLEIECEKCHAVIITPLEKLNMKFNYAKDWRQAKKKLTPLKLSVITGGKK